MTLPTTHSTTHSVLYRGAMVTADFAKGAMVTVCALGGLLIGFYVQDKLKLRLEADVDRRVETEYRRRLALLPTAAPGHAPLLQASRPASADAPPQHR